ncbi:MAG TPA: fumarylacetoacetate hydrolase family protein [Alphaproteobacteria bacterium]|nr:fumarylacetoacetate hydrolase family protein [Alphaproteobacteria bacterium]
MELQEDSTTFDGRYVFAPAPVPALPIRGSRQLFPVHRIYCVGRNYAEHAIEMGHDPSREAPFFFQKNPDTLVADGGVFPYPAASSDVHHELEMVVALKAGGAGIPVERALDCVFGYAVGLDMTRRDLQGEAKKLGRPWEVGKAFEAAAPCSAIAPASAIGHPAKGGVWLKVNGVPKQQGDLAQMIWKVPEMIAYLSGLFELRAGDLIFSGTPAGVGPVQRGDALHGGVDGVGELRVTVA